MVTVTQLACFRCLVEEKSVTEAAQRLCVTQPAVSQQLRLLTETLGCRLFHRRGREFQLTQEGQFVYEKAKGILFQLDGLEDELRSRGRDVVGKVRIGSGQVAAKTVVADAVHDMSVEYPDVSFSLCETNSVNLPELILSSRIDLGVGILAENRRGLRTERLLTGRLLLVCSRQSKLSSRKSMSRSELKALNLIRHSREDMARGIAYELYGEDEMGSKFQLEAMNTETIMSYVQRDLGVALASSYTIEWLRPSGIATVELAEETDIPWGVMSDASLPMAKAAKVFVNKLRQMFATPAAAEAIAPRRSGAARQGRGQ
ncbi:MAG: LysR family transcriptional regulator [Candidatus Pacebacteria bacterium]|nr:LysR family transcriptional regulator [Candidatus Paceibacterota bacterium]